MGKYCTTLILMKDVSELKKSKFQTKFVTKCISSFQNEIVDEKLSFMIYYITIVKYASNWIITDGKVPALILEWLK